MNLQLFSFVKFVLLLIIAVGISFISYSVYTTQYSKNNILYNAGDVLGVGTELVEVGINFGQQKNVGSPLIFGGAHSPRHPKAWDEIQNAGITMVRSDFALGWFIPPDITLDDYKNNINDIQNPKNWDQAEIAKIRNVFREAHKRNMKTMGILAYSTNWLTTGGTDFGPPKDWSVFEDLIEKSYRLYRADVDYLEIWNEPDLDFFMDTKNSGLKKEEAYLEIVKRSIPIIRKVDAEINDGKKMKIGVGVISQPNNTYILDKLLSETSLHSQIDFVSYHNYEYLPEPSYDPVKNVLEKYGLDETPIFLTEWSHTPKIKEQDPYILTDQGITYTGSKFIDFLNMGLAGANYFSLQPILPESKRGDEGFLGIYTTNGNSISMLPMVKTWSLMSKTLGLGKGESKIYNVENNGEKIAAWQNSDGEYGLVVSNNGYSSKQYSFNLAELPYKEDITLTAYVASSTYGGKEKLGTTVIRNQKNFASFKAIVPPNSVVGIKMGKTTWKDRLPF